MLNVNASSSARAYWHGLPAAKTHGKPCTPGLSAQEKRSALNQLSKLIEGVCENAVLESELVQDEVCLRMRFRFTAAQAEFCQPRIRKLIDRIIRNRIREAEREAKRRL